MNDGFIAAMDMILRRCKQQSISPVRYSIPKEIACPKTISKDEAEILAAAGFEWHEHPTDEWPVQGYLLVVN